MIDPKASSDTDSGYQSKSPHLASFVVYAVTVGVAATGIGLLARREISSVSAFMSDSGFVITVLVVGLLGGIAGERSRWFDRR